MIIHKSFQLNNTKFSSVATLLKYVEESEKESYLFLEEWFNKENYIIVQTSGSTGKPKQIKILKEHMINSAKATGNYFGLDNKTVALLCLSPNYIAGKMMLVRAMILGWQLDVVKAQINPLDGNKKQYNFCAMVPMQLASSLENLNKIDKLIVGGGAVPNSLLAKLQSLKTKVFATYGMTETVTHIAIKKLNHYKNTSYYKTLPDIKISANKRDCLVIDAPKISNNLVITNDIVTIISANTFEWLGRFDNIINSGGIKIVPEQIEEKLSKLISNRYFIASQKDTVLGEKVVLVVEGKIIEDLKFKIENSKLLTKYNMPKQVYFVTKFAETKTGKVNRKATMLLVNL